MPALLRGKSSCLRSFEVFSRVESKQTECTHAGLSLFCQRAHLPYSHTGICRRDEPLEVLATSLVVIMMMMMMMRSARSRFSNARQRRHCTLAHSNELISCRCDDISEGPLQRGPSQLPLNSCNVHVTLIIVSHILASSQCQNLTNIN